MKYPPEGSLNEKVVEAFKHPDIIMIVEETDSPSAAQKRAEDREYPYTAMNMIRELAMLKRNDLDVYKNFAPIEWACANASSVIQRVFSCQWGPLRATEADYPGILFITPHAYLPPLFWEYELRDEDNVSVFKTGHESQALPDLASSQIAFLATRATNDRMDSIRCIVGSASHSIPIGLNIEHCATRTTFSRAHLAKRFCWERYDRPHNQQFARWIIDEKGDGSGMVSDHANFCLIREKQ